MGAHGGTHVVRDTILGGYDTGYGIPAHRRDLRYAPGAPTTNYIDFQNAVPQTSYSTYSATSSGTWNAKHPKAINAYNADGGNITSYVNTGVTDWTNTYHAHWQYDTVLKKPVVVMNDVDGAWKAKSFGTGLGSWASYGLTAGSQYTISWLQWVDHLSKNAKAGLYSRTTAGSNGFHDGQANSPTAYNTKLYTWQRVYQTYTTSAVRDLNSTYLSIYMYGHYDVRATVKIADVQIDLLPYPTPPLIGKSGVSGRPSRSVSLYHRKKKSTEISTANMTYDSTGNMVFDGTNTDLSLGEIDLRRDFTLETVARKTSGVLCLFGQGAPATNQGMHIWEISNGTALRFGLYSNDLDCSWSADTNFHHWVFTYNHTTYLKQIYRDGVLVAQGTGSAYARNPSGYPLRPGSIYHTTGYANLSGYQPVVNVHGKVLTAEEVKRNFAAYKNRFGI